MLHIEDAKPRTRTRTFPTDLFDRRAAHKILSKRAANRAA
jgi:hypothetical protein